MKRSEDFGTNLKISIPPPKQMTFCKENNAYIMADHIFGLILNHCISLCCLFHQIRVNVNII